MAELAKSNINFDIPIQLAYMVLKYAKLRMLQFYFDYSHIYAERKDFELIEMDTDSLYFAISEQNFAQIVKQEKRIQYTEGQCHTPEISPLVSLDLFLYTSNFRPQKSFCNGFYSVPVASYFEFER